MKKIDSYDIVELHCSEFIGKIGKVYYHKHLQELQNGLFVVNVWTNAEDLLDENGYDEVRYFSTYNLAKIFYDELTTPRIARRKMTLQK